MVWESNCNQAPLHKSFSCCSNSPNYGGPMVAAIATHGCHYGYDSLPSSTPWQVALRKQTPAGNCDILTPRTSSGPMQQLKVDLCTLLTNSSYNTASAVRWRSQWSLASFVTSGKLARWQVHVYNMQPNFESGNWGQNCAYYNEITWKLRRVIQSHIMWHAKYTCTILHLHCMWTPSSM